MSHSRVFVVVGMGFGDEGKGSVVHWLASRHGARVVVRTGGPQAFHRVVTAAGAEHVFSQFGSGSLCGAATHLSREMVVDPDAILNEGRALAYEHGIRNILDLLTIHRDAVVITPFHGIANRVRELARGAGRHGTVGIGVGETVLDALKMAGAGREPIRARDLGSPDLEGRLGEVRDAKLRELGEVVEGGDFLSEADRSRAREEMAKLTDPATIQWAVERFGQVAERVRIVDTPYLAEEILGKPGCVVFEGSQGVLLDPVHGFAPYTTKVRTTLAPALELLDECGHEGDVAALGVVRAYHTRHGPGPFVTECPEMTRRLPDSFNGDHRWQGGFRVGPLDLVALRRAIDACGGAGALRGLVVTCVDRVHEMGTWRRCGAYTDARGARVESIALDASTTYLQGCRPEIAESDIGRGMGMEGFGRAVAELIRENVGVPVLAISSGPTERDKTVL